MPEQRQGYETPAALVVREVVADSAAATQAAGQALGAAVQPGQVIALRGNLGAGKTTFVQGLARGLGISARVASPTFVLVNEYTSVSGVRLAHVDTYRLGVASLDEAEGMGIGELLEDDATIVAIEWADRVLELLPADILLVELEYGTGEDQRFIRISALGPRSAAALQKIDF
ncbi:MAG: tRNA (adenosine(37)-N6)-threonylcarbamoyltransferase complex ATPase subunit type 1 TsaE [Caldilineaceae bacterium]